MAYRLQTPDGKKLYALRKQMPEPVFGIIKSVLGFRQFLLRGLDQVRGGWSLVTMAWNLKRMFTLCSALLGGAKASPTKTTAKATDTDHPDAESTPIERQSMTPRGEI